MTASAAARRDVVRALLAGAGALLGGAAVGVAGTALWYRYDRPTAADGSTPWGPEGPR